MSLVTAGRLAQFMKLQREKNNLSDKTPVCEPEENTKPSKYPE
jgi:hypothetical protein